MQAWNSRAARRRPARRAATCVAAALRRCALSAVLLAAAAPTVLAPPSAPAAADTGRHIALLAEDFTRNGIAMPPGAPDAPSALPNGGALLPCGERGVRWAVVFHMPEGATARLALEWEPGPDGLLFEVVLDGERLSPARDGWRPAPRTLSTDLGPAWLGAGSHLLEFVAREQSPGAALRLHALVLQSP